MKTVKLLSIAALAFVGALTAGCNSDDKIMDQPQQPQNTDNTVTLTTTVSMDGAAGTRALTSNGVKTFAVGETMALRYKNTKGDWVKAVSNALEAGDIADGSKSATFTFTLTNPDKTQKVDYIYPAAIVNPSGNMDESALFGSQNGTLNKIASTFDYSRKIGDWNGDNLPSLTLENQLAILAITLKNADGSSDITSSITGLTLSDGTKTYNVTREAAEGPIYVAIYPTASASIYITATNGTTSYAKTLTGKTYAAGNGYPVSWRMNKAVIWNSSKVAGIEIWSDGSFESDGITVAVSSEEDNAFFAESDIYLDDAEDKFTFSSSVGNIMKIEIHHSDYGNWYGPSAGWNGDDDYEGDGGGTFTWEGTPAAEVTLSSSDETGDINDITSIVFTIEYAPAGPTAYTLAESTVGMIVGTDGKAYAAADKDNLPTGVTAVAMVAYKSATAGSSLAIAMADEGEMDWETAKSTCEGKTAVTGGTWKLPSQDEWKQMFGANGDSEESYTGLNTAITTAGGTALQEYGPYWSSSEDEGGDAWRVSLDNPAYWINVFKEDMYLVRACLAF